MGEEVKGVGGNEEHADQDAIVEEKRSSMG